MAQHQRAPGGGAPPAPPDAPMRPAPLVHPRRVRLGLTAGSVALAAVAVAASVGRPGDDDTYLAIHGLVAAPFLTAAIVLTRHALREGPADYRPFWIRWGWACAAGVGAAVAGAVAGIGHVRALRVVDVVLLLACWPLIISAGRRLAAAQSGRRDPAVDTLDATMALVVLGAPGVLVALPAVMDAEEPVFAVPLALVVLVTPAVLYGSILGLTQLPRGERVTQAIGLGMCAALALNATLQVARALGTLDWPVPAFVAAHAVNMAAIPLVPLWAHRSVTPGLGRLPLERQARRAHPMPYVAAVVLPLLAALVYLTRDDRRWGAAFLAGVLLVTVALNAVRYTLMSRENRRLTGEVTALAAERRRLLADMLRALEADRRDTVTELHAQTVESLASLVSIAQTSHVTLPTDAAAAVRDAVGLLRQDLDERAEALRRLMLALRPPVPSDVSAHPLAAALLAYASDLSGDGAVGRPEVRVHVDAALALDRATLTIAYRIGQEALTNTFRHARAASVVVAAYADEDAVVVEVCDDGVGFDPGTTRERTGIATMRVFAGLGRGALTITTAPGHGTTMRATLRPTASEPPQPRRVDASHLQVVVDANDDSE
jgi:signal transduction histidine kinase